MVLAWGLSQSWNKIIFGPQSSEGLHGLDVQNGAFTRQAIDAGF